MKNTNVKPNTKFSTKGKSNGGKPDKKWKSKSTDVNTDTKDYKSNPIQWYDRYRDVLEASARIPFPYKPGMTLNLGSPNTVNYYKTIPGVMTIKYVPSVGYSVSNTSPISQAAKELYARVRASFSSNLQADAPDFIIYLMALDSIYSNIALMKRVYRTVNAYTPDNYAMPEAILLSMGITSAEIAALRENWIDGWGKLNELILMSRKFVCPAVMDVFNRHYWMNDNIYMDSPELSGQFYLFMPEHYYKYEALDSAETPDRLEPLPIAGMIRSWNTMYTAIRGQIEALAASDDAYTISGYLMRAFEGSQAFVVEQISQDDKLYPIYDSVVLTQIENSNGIYYNLFNTDGFYITQDPNTNAVIHKPAIVGSTNPQSFYPRNAFLNLRVKQPQVDDVVEASRLTTQLSSTKDTDGNYPIIAGTEICTGYKLLAYSAQSGNVVYTYTMQSDNSITTSTPEAYNNILNIVDALANFDWHPFISFISTTASNAFYYKIGDLYNPTVVSNTDIENINRVCLYSEFNAFSI